MSIENKVIASNATTDGSSLKRDFGGDSDIEVFIYLFILMFGARFWAP